MIPACSNRLTVVVFVVVWIVALPYLYRFLNSSKDPSLHSSTTFHNSGFHIGVAHTGHPDNPSTVKWVSYDVLPGVVSLEPTHIARVVYEGDTWLVECQTAKEIIVTPP